jgi:diacylglycerol kinase
MCRLFIFRTAGDGTRLAGQKLHLCTPMKRFISRVQFALQGWSAFFRNEKHGQIQAVVAVVVVAAGAYFGISIIEWMVLLLCIGLVLSLEMVNTAIEKLADQTHPEHHPQIGLVKDVAAGAVLWASVISVVVGLLIFLPRLLP